MKDGCPKCGGIMGGPRYSPGQGCACHPESLFYTCLRCGYSRREAVKDQGCGDVDAKRRPRVHPRSDR